MNCRKHPDTPLPPSRVKYGTGCRLCKREWRNRRPHPPTVSLPEAMRTLRHALSYLETPYRTEIAMRGRYPWSATVWIHAMEHDAADACRLLQRKIGQLRYELWKAF